MKFPGTFPGTIEFRERYISRKRLRKKVFQLVNRPMHIGMCLIKPVIQYLDLTQKPAKMTWAWDRLRLSFGLFSSHFCQDHVEPACQRCKRFDAVIELVRHYLQVHIVWRHGKTLGVQRFRRFRERGPWFSANGTGGCPNAFPSS